MVTLGEFRAVSRMALWVAAGSTAGVRVAGQGRDGCGSGCGAADADLGGCGERGDGGAAVREAGPGLGLAVAVPVPVHGDPAPGQGIQDAGPVRGGQAGWQAGGGRPGPGGGDDGAAGVMTLAESPQSCSAEFPTLLGIRLRDLRLVVLSSSGQFSVCATPR